MPKSSHPASGDLYTPITPEIVDLLWRLYAEYGSWTVVAYHCAVRLRMLRRIRNRESKTISQSLLDKIITLGRIGNIRDYPWFTADDLVAMGIWEPPAPPLDEQKRRLESKKGDTL